MRVKESRRLQAKDHRHIAALFPMEVAAGDGHFVDSGVVQRSKNLRVFDGQLAFHLRDGCRVGRIFGALLKDVAAPEVTLVDEAEQFVDRPCLEEIKVGRDQLCQRGPSSACDL